MTTSQDMMNEFKRQQQLKEYRERQKQEQQSRFNPMNAMAKINSLRNNVNKVGSGLSSLGMKASQSSIPRMASLGVGAQNLGNKLQSFGNTSNAASNVSNVANTANTVGNAGQTAGTLSNAAGALGKAGGAVGAVAGGASAANNFAKGDYVNGGLDTAKTVASFMGPWGMAAAAAINMYQKMQSKQKAKQMKEMQKSQEQMSKTEQANEESLAELQDTFQNDSEQAAQNMTLPTQEQTLPQDMMSQINPNYTSSDSGSPMGFASDINTPDETQTLQNDQSGVPQIEQSNTQQPATNSVATKNSIMDRIRSGLTDLKTGYDDNVNTSFTQGDLYNRVANNQQTPATPSNYELLANDMKNNFTDEQIQAAKQGLNGGNADIAALVDKYSINKPTTEEEIALAREGNFNPQEVTGAASPVNSQQTKKSIMQRIGELAGTSQRIMSNPYVQGLVAGTIAGVNKGDMGEGLEYGINWAQNKAKSDNYYRLMNPGSSYTPFLGNYDTNDYKTQQSIELDKQELAEKIRHNIATADEIKRYHDLVNNENVRYHDIQNAEKVRHNKATESEASRFHSGQLGISQQRLALDMKRASTFGQKQKLLDDYKKQVQNDVAAYISAPPGARQELKAQLVQEHGVDILKYLNEGGKGTSTNTSTNTDEPSIYSGLMNRFPDWAYTDYVEEDED
jgi:hypothetical protein